MHGCRNGTPLNAVCGTTLGTTLHSAGLPRCGTDDSARRGFRLFLRKRCQGSSSNFLGLVFARIRSAHNIRQRERQSTRRTTRMWETKP
eukprot:3111849-Prymnesium_polylepis.1